MPTKNGKNVPRVLLILTYAAGLALFYYKYVPLVMPFQAVFVPLLLAAALIAWRDIRAGTLFFIFLFPLINNLPYFFGIHEPFPHAPAALVLFLFFFLGFLLRREPLNEEGSAGEAVLKPLVLFSLVIGASAIITFFRYANFFPFLSPDIYELAVNRQGVSAGGAIMSVVFQALNYLSGFAFFLIFSKTLRSKSFLRKALFVLGLSSLLSLAFAFFQHFGHLTLGNNPSSAALRLINGTFKDALSFGAYLSMAVPLFLGVFFAFPKILLKIFSSLIVVLSLFIIIFTGSKSGIIGLLVSLLCFLILGISRGRRSTPRLPALASSKRGRAITALILIIAVFFSFFLIKYFVTDGIKRSTIIQRFSQSKDMLGVRLTLLWKPALKMTADYPLTGVGIGGFIIEVANYSDVYENPEVIPESAENYVLQVLSELGLIGLGLVLWIAWEILRQIRKGFSRKEAGSRTIFLLIGAVSGVLAFVIDAQAHSYIGSYEIKYTLWLLVALIYAVAHIRSTEDPAGIEGADSAAGDTERPKQKPPNGRRFKILIAFILALYGAVHLWNSTHSLSLKSRTEKLGIIQKFGLNKLEKTADGREFRWTRGYGGLTLKIEKPVLVIPIQASHPDIQKKPVKVKIYLITGFFKHKRLLKEIALAENRWQNVILSVPEDVGHEAILLFKVSRTWNPMKTTGVPDPRNLGVAVGKIEFRD